MINRKKNKRICTKASYCTIWPCQNSSQPVPQSSAPLMQSSNRMASNVSMSTATASFPSGFLNSCNIQGNVQVFFGLQSRSNDKKWLDFLRPFVSDLLITQFWFSFQSDCLFQDKRRSIQIWQWRDSLNQSQFFAKHSNQSVRFILYRQ